MFKKITEGYVVQTFADSGKCVRQEFVASDSEYEDENGNPIHPTNEQYQPYDMVQPTRE
jgi:hypothetical protein